MTKRSNRKAIKNAIIAGLFNALFLILAFPPFSFWGFAFLIPLPLFAIARSRRLTPSRTAFWAAIGCLPGWIWTHAWVSDISAAGVIPLVIQLSFFTFLFVWIASKLYQRLGHEILLFPIIWVGVEFLRGSLVWTGYPWYLIAHPLIDSPLGILAMPASWGGVYFVSYLCATYSIVLLLAITSRSSRDRLRAGLIAGAIFTAWVGVGYLMIPPDPDNSDRITVAVIQPNIPQDNRTDWTVRQRVRDWLTLRDLTLAATRDPKTPEPVDVIIWPEGFVPGWTFDPVSLDLERDARLAWTLTPRTPDDVPELTGLPSKIEATMVVDELLILQQALNIPMVVGSVAFDNLQIVDTEEGIEYQRDAMYNSAFVVLDGEPQPVWYDKLHLTPFGEVMPYISNWDWLEKMLLSFGAQGMKFALSEGKEPRVLTIPIEKTNGSAEINLATPICFEATISSVCRKLVFSKGKRQASVMVNMTNDGWFGSWDPGRTTHVLIARWRCIELNTPMIRSANTGISCAIDNRGRVQTQDITPISLDDPRQGYLIADVIPTQGVTVFARIGDLFGWLCFAIMCALMIAPIFPRSKAVRTIQG
ncbi:MAG: apolipoprotein N-acyltransferase [Phycisphaerales bacterium]|nr:apolipoprotein N-acyltransferase [Phycisphaerales bacterium]